jgi:PAS domain S-box-containing protein
MCNGFDTMQEDSPNAAVEGSTSHEQGSNRFRLLVDSVVDYAIFMLDTEGRVLTWNAGAERLKGYRPQEVIGRSFEIFYPAEALAAGWPKSELRVATEQCRFEEEGWRVRKDGSTFWADVVITALRNADGSLAGFAKVTRDLTERRRHEQTLRRSEEQLRLLLESVNDYAIYMLDVDGRVLTWNSGAQAIKGYAASDVVGRNFAMFFTPEDVAAGTPQAELDTAARTGRADSEGWRVRKDGTLFWAGIVLTPVHDVDGVLHGFAKVTRDLSEQRRMSDLEQSSQRMQEFIAMLAHELRNPLAPIRNAVSAMQLNPGLPAQFGGLVDIIGRQIWHMTRLVDDLLDVSRIATGKIPLKRGSFDFRSVVELSIEATRSAIDARRHSLTVQLPEVPLPMQGDSTRLAQSLQNLLNNAARYTPPEGRIGLAVERLGDSLVTTVSDNGIGVAPEAQERIFELFTPERHGTPHIEPGLGLGLSLARSLVELHGGRLTVHSAGPGLGSSFVMTLPMQPVDAAEPGRGDAGGAARDALAMRVLVVDDNRDSADSMAALVELMGHTVRVAYGAEDAVRTAADFRPQTVLLDLNMPDGDGFSVMKRLRAQATEPVYIAAMTGYGQQRDRDATLASGFQSHLTKPVQPEHLEQAMGEARARQRVTADDPAQLTSG